jgi:uncharacterized RDD family membrane protein YckC
MLDRPFGPRRIKEMIIKKVFYWFFFIAIILITNLFNQQIGYSIHISDTTSSVASGTHPIMIFLSLSFLLFIYFIPKINTTSLNKPASVLIRVIAFFINFIVSIFCVASITSLIPLIIEYQRTNVFAWFFTRNYVVNTDYFTGFPIIIISMMLMLLLTSVPWVLGKQNYGEYLCNIKIVFFEKDQITIKHAFKRSFAGFAACLGSIITIIIGHNKNNQYWHDNWCKTEVVKL